MDGALNIERNREALKRILAGLVAMAGLAAGGPATLTRRLHRAVTRLLYPAESAARRLIIALARGMVVELPPPRPARPKPQKPDYAAWRRLGIAVVLSPAQIAAQAQAARAAAAKAAARAARPPKMSLPLLDPLRRFRRYRRYVPAHREPRIWTSDSDRRPLPPPPSPNDPVDATRLGLRLSALGRALDDLPGHAKRFARWNARRAAGRVRRRWPLRRGRPPGSRRRPTHEVHEALEMANELAFFALEYPDTS